MDLDPDDMRSVILRLKRAHGHLGSVIRMLEKGTDCESALTQLAAVNKALNRGGYALVAGSLQQCLAGTGSSMEEADVKRLEKLFLAFA